MRLAPENRVRMLASEATTPSFTSSVTRDASAIDIGGPPVHYNNRFRHPKTCCMQISSTFRLRKVAEADFPTRFGQFRIYGFEGSSDDVVEEAVALVRGSLTGTPPPLVRIHSECLTGDVFHSLRCDCRPRVELARDG